MSEVVVTKSSNILELRLERPTKKNALTFAMYETLIAALDDASKDTEIRAVVLTAAGNAFCAGNDIADFLAAGEFDIRTAPPARFIEAIIGFDKPLVAAVNGAAVGVGTTLLLHCDLVYATESARLSMPFVSLGLVPEAASSLLLPQRVGRAIASEMILLGTTLDAKRALALGLVNELCSDADLATTARRKAAELAAMPPNALRASRSLLRGDTSALLARAREEARIFAERLSTDEAREALFAFFQRKTSKSV